MSSLDTLKTAFFREPRKRKFDWILVGFGIVEMGLSIASVVGGEYLILGVAFLLMGGAELLSIDQRRVSALFRVSAVVAFVAYGIAIILTV